MSFRKNDQQQISMADSFNGLTAREKKFLERSWATVFAKDIFPAIDEEPFRVLYSDKDSRPNTPVNVIIGSLILQQLFKQNDDEMFQNLLYDLRYQVALHTTSFKEQPFSDKTLSRFRRRCYDYEALTGVDLLHDCIVKLSERLRKLMDIDLHVRRMDSMMIEACIRTLSRMELLYECVSNLAICINKKDGKLIPEAIKHYCDPNDFNQMFYHDRESSYDERITKILLDADTLIKICFDTEYETCVEYQLLVRCLSEQTVIEDDNRRLRTKDDGGMDSHILQNPSDPEATYRTKAGKGHRGYCANLEETVGKNGSIVTDYQFEDNTYSDVDFFKDSMERTEVQKETALYITDGAYASEENRQLASEKNICLITTNLTGKKTPDIHAEFEFNEDGTKILHCPAGHSPRSCSYNRSDGSCRASFERDLCVKCPYKEQCIPKVHKRVSVKQVSKKSSNRAKQQRYFKNDAFKAFSRLRNGVETLPSLLRRKYQVDHMPRGKQRGRFFFGCKLGALNFGKYLGFVRGTGKYAQNPLLA